MNYNNKNFYPGHGSFRANPTATGTHWSSRNGFPHSRFTIRSNNITRSPVIFSPTRTELLPLPQYYHHNYRPPVIDVIRSPRFNGDERQNRSNEKVPVKRRYNSNASTSISSVGVDDIKNHQRPKKDCEDETSPKKQKTAMDPENKRTLSNKFKQLDNDLNSIYYQNRQTERRLNQKEEIRYLLERVFMSMYPNSSLHIVGSTLSGFAGEYSDLDMCLLICDGPIDQRRAAPNILMLLKRCISQSLREFYNVQVIFAKVPILKMLHIGSRIEIDVNINNSVGIRNTKLLAWYSQIDERVKPLVLIVKHWARYHDINDASQQTLSSYSLELMVIHYLQFAVTPSVLPCLQQIYSNKFTLYSNIRQVNTSEPVPQHLIDTSTNKQTLGELFYGFLKYFAFFNFKSLGISVRVGQTVPRETLIINSYSNSAYMGSPNRNQWNFICIEEPFDCSNTARSVHREDKFYLIIRTFKKCYHLLHHKKQMKVILQPFTSKDLLDIRDSDSDDDSNDDDVTKTVQDHNSKQSVPSSSLTSTSLASTSSASTSSMSIKSPPCTKSLPKLTKSSSSSSSSGSKTYRSNKSAIPVFDLSESDSDNEKTTSKQS